MTFIIKFPVGGKILSIKANGYADVVKWSYPTEFQDIVKAAEENGNTDVWIQCYAYYDADEKLYIRCSSVLNPMPGNPMSGDNEPPAIAPDVSCGDSRVPTADSVYHFVKKETHNITQGDFISFETTDYENEHDVPTKEDKVEEIKISVKTNTKIENDATTVPTTKAVKDFVEGFVNDPTAYVFPNKSAEERKYFIIYDAWQNPVLMSDDFQEELVDGYRLFDYKPWKKFHIDMPNLET